MAGALLQINSDVSRAGLFGQAFVIFRAISRAIFVNNIVQGSGTDDNNDSIDGSDSPTRWWDSG
jgi:hypothetical protein